ncbi:MAG TPA: hypothetical protein VL177_02680 [Terriglobales bacterium]|nr:hypothetical protein [Terriglobales bacterium]
MAIIGAGCGLVVLAYEAISKFVDFAVGPFDSRIPGLGILLVAIAALTLALASLDWRRGLWFLMFWLVIADIVRRLLPSQPPQLMLVADLIVAGIYIGYFVETVLFGHKRRLKWPSAFLASLALFATVSVVGMFNPALPTFWFGFVGLHSYAWFLPLVFVGTSFSQDSQKSLDLMLFVSALCIPLFFLAIYQYFHFGTLPVALQSVRGGLDYHSFGNEAIPLISSAFGNAEKYSRYCALALFLSVAMLGDLQLSVGRRVLAFTSACVALGGIFVSDRRTPLYLCLVGLLFVAWKMRYVFRTATFWVSLLLICVLAGFAHLRHSQEIASSSEYFVSSLPEIQERVNFLLDEISVVTNGAGLLGRGTGADSQGLDYVPGGAPLLTAHGVSIENGLTKVWWELGPFGLASFLLFWFVAGGLLFKKAVRARNSRACSYALCYATYFCIIFVWFTKGHQVMGDVATGIDQWFFFGIIAGLPLLPNSKSLPNQIRREPVRPALKRCAS